MYALRLAGVSDHLSVRHLLFETDSGCRRVLTEKLCSSSVWLSDLKDSTGNLGSVLALTDDDCRPLFQILEQFPNLVAVLFVGGSPCQGLSRANPCRELLADPRSALIWVFAVLVARTRAHATASRSQLVVHYLVENVVTEAHARDAITALLGSPAQLIDAAQWSPSSRPRTYWCSLGKPPAPPSSILKADAILEVGWQPLWELLGARANTDFGHRWCTLTRPFKPGHPSEFPEPYPRHSLGIYTEFGLAFRSDITSEQRILKSMRISRVSNVQLRTKSSSAIHLRGMVPRAIHSGGLGDCLRPLLPQEVERAHGYPPCSSGYSSIDPGTPQGWDQLSRLGNGFSVFVVSALLQPFANFVASGSATRSLDAGPTTLTQTDALLIMSSGGSRHRKLPPPPVAHRTPGGQSWTL